MVRSAVLLGVVALTIVLVRAYDARSMAELEPWHTAAFDEEFHVSSNSRDMSFADYQLLEQAVFDELDRKVYRRLEPEDERVFNRFFKGSVAHPEALPRNWNRSYELAPEHPRGGILLLHGLTDSPYSLRAVAQVFRANGFYALVPRLPGHGTAPSALRQVSFEDWLAVVRLCARHVRTRIGPDTPFYVGGYSNGGAMAVKYTLDSLVEDGLERPERVFLFSPALGVTRFAVFASWHRLLSRLPYFRQFEWQSIQPEYDPFKYNSFPKMAGHQTFRLTEAVAKQVDALKRSGDLEAMPPMLTFQSLVDSTVLTPALVTGLYDKLETDDSELVLYDINRFGRLSEFIKQKHGGTLTRLMNADQLPYTLSVVTNLDSDSETVVVRTRGPQLEEIEETALYLEWPDGVYSLSHVAIPFRPDDPYYGPMDNAFSAEHLGLGSLQPRGERDILTVPMKQFLRLRYNPFFAYLEKRVSEFCEVCGT